MIEKFSCNKFTNRNIGFVTHESEIGKPRSTTFSAALRRIIWRFPTKIMDN